MKTKVKRLSKRTLALVLGMMILVSCILVGSVITANAYSVYGGRVYFDTQGHWANAKYIYCAIWYSNKNTRYLERLYNIPNTTVYTSQLVNINRADVSSMRFLGTTSTWISDSVNSGWRSYEDGGGYTTAAYYTTNTQYNLNTNDKYYGYVTSDTKDTSPNFAYASGANVTIENNNAKLGAVSTTYNNNAQTINVKRLVNGSWTQNTDSTKAGTVGLYARYYTDYQSTSALGSSTASHNTTTYSNGALHTNATAKVESIADGYTFAGWFDTSDNLLSTEEEYTYFIEGATTLEARFFKADEAYTEEKPDDDQKVKSGVLLFNNLKTYTTRAWLYEIDYNYPAGNTNKSWNIPLTQHNSSSLYYISNATFNSTAGGSAVNPITTTFAPYAILTKGTTTDIHTWPGDGSQSGTISEFSNGTNPTAVYYHSGESDGSWTKFEHLEINLNNVKDSGGTTITDSSTRGQIDNPGQTLTINATLGGTMRSGSTVKFYFTNDGGTTHYLIGTNTNVKTSTTSINFIPPTTGKYKFYATVTDNRGLEVDVPTADLFDLTVGTEGYYVSGNEEFVGAYWGVAPNKGKMTNSDGTIWTKTFKSVPAGTHQFRITDLDNYVAGTGGTNAANTYTLTGNGVTLTTVGDNIQFTLDGKSKVVVTVDSEKDANGKYPVTVTVSEVAAKNVTVYANTGGTVSITADGATFDVAEGKSTKIKVAEGDSINLTAAAGEGYTFDHWEKNLDTAYSATATLTDETINDTTVYVAAFSSSGSGGDWTGTNGGSSCPASPTVGESTSKYLVYSYGDNGPGKAGTQLSTYNSGNYYFADITDVYNKNGFYFALSDNTNNGGIHGNKSEQLNGQTVSAGSDITVTDTSGNKLFKAQIKDNSDVTGNAYFVYLYSFDTTKFSAIAVQAVYSGSGAVNYQFFYKAADGGIVEGEIKYNAAVTYYAKDSNFRNQNTTDKNTYITTKTTVTEVEDLVTIDTDKSTTTYKTGKALKGAEITVSTTISGTCKNGQNNAIVDAADKFYVVGYSFNGITPEILSEKAKNGSNEATYSCTYLIPADMTENYLEITPIYFLKDAYDDNTAMFYINGYDDTIKDAGWGNTLFIYPFYHRYKNNNNDKTGGDTTFYGQAQNFSGYPGQPVVNFGGQLYTQIPLTNDGSATGTDSIGNPIKGVTINNGYFDGCHMSLCKFVTNHHQTYDYDDFQKIYKEKKTDAGGNKLLHSIFFSFKYYAQDTTNQHRLYSYTNTTNSGGRKNATIETGTRLATSGTVAEATMTSYPGANNKWEDLTNALGDKVDLFGNTTTKTSDHPVRVVSMGYEYNNSGEYATEWAVYKWDGSNYTLAYDSSSSKLGDGAELNSSIVPSALVMNSVSSFSNYQAMDGDVSIQNYDDLYSNLESLAGEPVKICYEHDAPIHYNTPAAYRCDGRWTYTTVNDFVKSNIVIEYKANGETEYAVDPFNGATNEGTTTKAKAYFTNGAYYGATESNSEIIDHTENYTFKAEEGGSYEFAGWYAKDSAGKYQKIENVTEDLVAESPRTANLTFVARFDYVASGSLTISNSLASASSGRGTTYLGVTLINGTKETVLANVASNTAAVKIGSAYINSSSNYTIKVDIRTVPNGENTFNSYACNTTNGSDVVAAASNTNIYDSDNSSNNTDTYTITVKTDIFSSTTQVVKAIEYISTLNAVNYTYSVEYNYPSRKYGNQAFTKTGSLTAAQIADESVVIGTLNSEAKTLTPEFLASIAPHESNFMSKISWTFGTAVQSCSYTAGTNTYAFSVTVPVASASDNISGTSRKAYFTVPYSLNAGKTGVAADNLVYDSDGVNRKEYCLKTAAAQTFEISGTYAGTIHSSDGSNIVAPEVIWDGTTMADTLPKYQYFKYWEFTTTSGKPAGKCFYPEFNYLLYDNYNVTAVYGDTPVNYMLLYNDNASTTISYIGNSRNQWNNGHKGSYEGANDAGETAGDLIYNDFIISYKPTGSELIKDIDGAETGIIIQKLDEVQLNTRGKNSKTLDEYASTFTSEELATNLTSVTKYAKSANAGVARVNDKASIKVTVDKSSINNKNRIHYAYSMFSSMDSVNMNTKQYFYRVYSYMKVNGTTTVSETPTYFCMYDIATE